MKRRDFEGYLRKHHCVLVREGRSHSIFENQVNGKSSTVPRHREIKNFLCNKICKDLDIPKIF